MQLWWNTENKQTNKISVFIQSLGYNFGSCLWSGIKAFLFTNCVFALSLLHGCALVFATAEEKHSNPAMTFYLLFHIFCIVFIKLIIHLVLRRAFSPLTIIFIIVLLRISILLVSPWEIGCRHHTTLHQKWLENVLSLYFSFFTFACCFLG